MKKRIFILAIIGLLSGQSLFAQFVTDEKRKSFTFKAVAGVNSESFDVNVASEILRYDFGSFMTPNIGFEAEYIFGFNQNKVRFVFGANYHGFKQDEVTVAPSRRLKSKYTTIDVPFGIRYYFFVNEDIKFFLNGFYRVGITLNKETILDYTPNASYDDYNNAKPKMAFMYGGGIEYKKYSLQVRLNPTLDLLGYSQSSTDYKIMTFLLGYQLF